MFSIEPVKKYIYIYIYQYERVYWVRNMETMNEENMKKNICQTFNLSMDKMCKKKYNQMHNIVNYGFQIDKAIY